MILHSRESAFEGPEGVVDDLVFRRAATADAPAIASIYNHYITSSTATFDTEPKSVADREEWIAERGESHPVLVAHSADGVIAWGALTAYRDRPAWAGTAEVAVYVEKSRTGRGVGSRMLAELVAEARKVGHHVLVSQIVAENTASLAMTMRAGFQVVGTLHEVGCKFDRWLDVVILELNLARNT